MLNGRTRAALLAGAATLSLTAAGWASEYSNLFVFGDRYLDAGQYVDPDVAFDNTALGDGRRRFTNRVEGGDYGYPYSDVISNHFGFGDTAPSQPQSTPQQEEDGVVPETGTNYAGAFYRNQDIYNSIANPVVTLVGITFGSGDARVSVDGTQGVGVLHDAEKRALLPNSIVLIGGGFQDVRHIANIDYNLDGTVDRSSDTAIGLNRMINANEVAGGARLIADGAIALRNEGANVTVVSNLFDLGYLPESKNEVDAATQGIAEISADIASDPANDTQRNRDLLAMFQYVVDNPDEVRSLRSDATEAYNAALNARLNGQNNILVIDHKSVVDEVMANPGRFGLNAEFDQQSNCLNTSVLYPCEASGEGPTATFFDNGIDLTQAGHEVLGDQIKAVLDAPVHVNAVPLAGMVSGRIVANAGEAQVTPERIARRGWAPFVSLGAAKTTFHEMENEGDQDLQNLTGIAGVVFVPTSGVAIGVAGGVQDVSDPSGNLDFGYEGSGVFGTAFAGLDKGRVFANASATVGKVDYDAVNRNTLIGTGQFTNTGETKADVWGASVEVGVRAYTYNTVAIGPIASLDHWEAEADGYTESGWGVTSMTFSKLQASSTRGSAGVFLEAGSLDYDPMPVVFRGKALYTHEFEDEGTNVTASLTSNPGGTFTRPGRGPAESSFTFGAQVSARLGPVIGSIGYDGRFGDTSDHSGRVDVSMPFNY